MYEIVAGNQIEALFTVFDPGTCGLISDVEIMCKVQWRQINGIAQIFAYSRLRFTPLMQLVHTQIAYNTVCHWLTALHFRRVVLLT